MTIVSQRQALQQVIERMPDKLITEVVTFVKYLQRKGGVGVRFLCLQAWGGITPTISK